MDIQWLLPMPQQMTQAGKDLPALFVLRDGDLFTASVLAVEKGNDALLDFGQFKAYARLPLPVASGQMVQIKVEAEGGQLRMAMVPNGGIRTNHRLDIRLFEPVSDKPFLFTHARSLVDGESLQGRITGFEKDGLMLVDFGKFKVFAKIDIPVRQGETLFLTVSKTEGGIALNVDPRSQPSGTTNMPPSTAAALANVTHQSAVNQPADRPHTSIVPGAAGRQTDGVPSPAIILPTIKDIAVLRELVEHLLAQHIQGESESVSPLSPTIKSVLANIQQALNPASPSGDMATLMVAIRKFVENSGLYFEKHLEQTINTLQARLTPMTVPELAAQPAVRDLIVNDLKPNLLMLKTFLEMQTLTQQEMDRHTLETLKSVVQRVVSHIEQQQLTATEKPADPDAFQSFSHLLFLTDSRRNARLKVYYAKKSRSGAHKQPRVSLLLDMDRMGMIRTDLWMVDKNLSITFFVKDEAVKAVIENEHHCVEEMLQDSFNTVALSVVVNEKKIAAFDGDDLTNQTRRQVDLNI